MDVIDWILNLACVLLWLNWQSIRFTRLPQSIGVSLAGTLRQAAPARAARWSSLGALVAILFIRSLFYLQIGSAVSWTPKLELGAVVLTFRSDQLQRMLLFSFLGCAVWLCGLYSWLLLLSVANSRMPDTDPWQRLIRLHLGRLERLPVFAKLALPSVAAILFWIAAHPLLAQQGLIPHARSQGQLVWQAALLGLSIALFWKLLVLGILSLHIVNSYLYLGRMPFWQFTTMTAKNLLRPLGFLPLRIGQIDLAPLAGIAIVLGIAELMNRWLPEIFQRL